MKQPVAGTTPAASYSPGMLASGRTLYVSGQGPLDGGAVVSGTIEEETQLTLENLARVLADGGATPADVVRVGIFLQDLDEFDAMDAVYKRFFAERAPGAALPARTTVGAALRGIKVEIDCVAVLGD